MTNTIKKKPNTRCATTTHEESIYARFRATLRTACQRLRRTETRPRHLPSKSRDLGDVGYADHTRGNNLGGTGFHRIKIMILPKVTAFAFISIYLIVMSWLFLPYKAVEDMQIEVLTPVVKAGDHVSLLMSFEKNSKCTPDIKWFLVDGFVLQLSDGGITRPQGRQGFVREVFIPENTPKEMVKLRIEYSCQVNPLRTEHYSWDTPYFEVI